MNSRHINNITTKTVLSLLAIAALNSSVLAEESVSEQLKMLKAQIVKLENQLNEQNSKVEKQLLQNSKKITKVEKKVKKTSKKLNLVKAHDAGDNIKWDVDFRTQIDSLQYELGSGKKVENSSLLSNRLWLGMKYQADDNTLFRGILGYNKIYGDNRAQVDDTSTGNNAQFDWVTNESITNDNALKVKEAYWLYTNDSFFGNEDVPWSASVGRRPSTDGLGISLRVDQERKSALSHTVNVEFDGGSLKFDLDKVTGINGMWLKFCGGRGLTNSKLRFSSDGLDYTKDSTTQNVDMAGFIFVPYDDGQYSVHMNYAQAWNLIGNLDANGDGASDDGGKFHSFGDIEYFTSMVKVDGIGDGISDFLDDSIFFASYAQSKTSPNAGQSMLGSSQSQTGHSYWIGLNIPDGMTEDGRFGLEWNRGSKYWRSMTYGEDTAVGSKIAARGTAWEAYYNKSLTKALSSSVRFTQIDYDYTGSNGFFGDLGAPNDSNSAAGTNAVKKAQNITAYIRYQF